MAIPPLNPLPHLDNLVLGGITALHNHPPMKSLCGFLISEAAQKRIFQILVVLVISLFSAAVLYLQATKIIAILKLTQVDLLIQRIAISFLGLTCMAVPPTSYLLYNSAMELYKLNEFDLCGPTASSFCIKQSLAEASGLDTRSAKLALSRFPNPFKKINLGRDVERCIAENLTFRELFQLMRVSKAFHRIATDKHIWTAALQRKGFWNPTHSWRAKEGFRLLPSLSPILQFREYITYQNGWLHNKAPTGSLPKVELASIEALTQLKPESISHPFMYCDTLGVPILFILPPEFGEENIPLSVFIEDKNGILHLE